MFETLPEFFAMGGYAVYIWPSYGLTALVLVALLGLTLRKNRQLKTIENHLEELDQ